MTCQTSPSCNRSAIFPKKERGGVKRRERTIIKAAIVGRSFPTCGSNDGTGPEVRGEKCEGELGDRLSIWCQHLSRVPERGKFKGEGRTENTQTTPRELNGNACKRHLLL